MSDTEKKDAPDPEGEWDSPVIPPPAREKGDEGKPGKKEWEPPIAPPSPKV